MLGNGVQAGARNVVLLVNWWVSGGQARPARRTTRGPARRSGCRGGEAPASAFAASNARSGTRQESPPSRAAPRFLTNAAIATAWTLVWDRGNLIASDALAPKCASARQLPGPGSASSSATSRTWAGQVLEELESLVSIGIGGMLAEPAARRHVDRRSPSVEPTGGFTRR